MQWQLKFFFHKLKKKKKKKKRTFNWGWLTGSEVQLIIKAGAWQHPVKMVQEELRVLHLHLEAASRILTSRQLQ